MWDLVQRIAIFVSRNYIFRRKTVILYTKIMPLMKVSLKKNNTYLITDASWLQNPVKLISAKLKQIDVIKLFKFCHYFIARKHQ